jgi:hypothetical protein
MMKRLGYWSTASELLGMLALLLVELLWIRSTELAFHDYGVVVLCSCLLLAVWRRYAHGGRSQSLADMAYFGAAWIIFSVLGAVLTYLAVYGRQSLYDAEFIGMDRALGFAWPAWRDYVHARPLLDRVLGYAYDSLLMQIAFSVLCFAHLGQRQRNSELFWCVVIALLFTAAGSGLYPAVGALAYFDIDLARAVHLVDLNRLRLGGQEIFSVPAMQGIVTWPSYHAALAVLFAYVHRGYFLRFVAMAALNVVMLVSTLTYGGHYLVDVLGGIAAAALAIAIVRSMQGVRMRREILVSDHAEGALKTSMRARGKLPQTVSLPTCDSPARSHGDRPPKA